MRPSSAPTVVHARLARSRRLVAVALGFLFAGAFYLMSIDIADLPELYAGAGAAAAGSRRRE